MLRRFKKIEYLQMAEVKTNYTYATLMEMNDEHAECWYFFIRKEGNEENLKHLQDQLSSIEWSLEEDQSTFDLETTYFVSEQTAKEMTKLDLNKNSFHRKFDGVLQKIDFGLKSSHSDDRKMSKVCKLLQNGGIEDFIDMEDIDPEDLNNVESESESDEAPPARSSHSSSAEKTVSKPKKGIPQALKDSQLPRVVKAKRHGKK